MGIWQTKNVDMSVVKIGASAAEFCDIAKSDKFQTAKQNQTERQPTRIPRVWIVLHSLFVQEDVASIRQWVVWRLAAASEEDLLTESREAMLQAQLMLHTCPHSHGNMKTTF